MVRNQAAGARPASGFIHWQAPLLAALGLLAVTFPASGGAADAASEAQRIWLFLGASEESGREGFLRVVNHSAQTGEVHIEAADDAGMSAAPVTLAIGAAQAVHLNSRDLEGGNAGKGLPEGIGPGQGDWRLTLSSDLDIEALSYVRTADGFVTTMHDIAPTMDNGSHRVVFLNPGSNHRQESHLRLVNPGEDAATIRITGMDDAGQPGTAAVTAEVPAGQSRTLTAAELESGIAPGLSGALGDGAGKWRLRVESERDIVAMSLLATPTGHLANLSAPPPEADAGGAHVVPLFLSASDPLERQGFLRVVNRSDTAGTVRIEAFDQSDFAYDPVTLSLGPRQARHLNSTDLESGNASKGLAGSLGAGRGDWRLELTSDLGIEALAYIRTKDGFVTSMHDLAPTADGLLHKVAFLNPGSNDRQASHLRLVNRGTADAEATIEGIDDAGQSPGTLVRVRVPAGKAVSLDSKSLEEGGDGFGGALGNGKGKWRLWITSDEPLLVASLLDTPTGHLANLSTAPSRGAAKPSSADAEAEAFRTLASPIVQSKCVTCHVEGGASGNTRLVFVTDADDDHMSKNLNAFRSLLESVNDATGDGTDYVLGKIQGVSHGGGVQVAAGTDEFDNMRRFLELLGGTGDRGPQSITAKNLFETVRMESPRRTLYRAAMILAGRVPTAEELAPFPGGTMRQLRDTVRRMMTGPEFHEFLIRGANDRLLTDSLADQDILADGHVGVVSNGQYSQFSGYEAERERLQAGGPSAGGRYSEEYYEWSHEVRFGAPPRTLGTDRPRCGERPSVHGNFDCRLHHGQRRGGRCIQRTRCVQRPGRPLRVPAHAHPGVPARGHRHGRIPTRRHSQHHKLPAPLPDNANQPQPRPRPLDLPALPRRRHPELGTVGDGCRCPARHPQSDHAQPGLHQLPHTPRPGGRCVPELCGHRLLPTDDVWRARFAPGSHRSRNRRQGASPQPKWTGRAHDDC